jgi:putative aminopeptidase FrvX
MMELFNLVENLTNISGPAGREEKIRSFIHKEAEAFGDELFVDALGNLIVTKRNPTGKKLLLAAHMDEIGLMITFIEENGFLRFSAIGGIDKEILLGTRVIFGNGTAGIIGREKLKEKEVAGINRFYIDIGAKSKDEAQEKVKIGETANFYPLCHRIGSRVIAKSLDNRAGCALLLQVLKRIPAALPNEVYFVFTSQEEVGLRGAGTASYQLNPDYALAVDVTRTGDTPDPEFKMDLSLGNGPAIKIKDSSVICHPAVVQRMIRTAEKINIPFQLEVLERGGTDAGSIHLSREGVPSGALSIPCRYIHTPGEMVDLADIAGGISLLIELLKEKW